jgi:hypothetical protein
MLGTCLQAEGVRLEWKGVRSPCSCEPRDRYAVLGQNVTRQAACSAVVIVELHSRDAHAHLRRLLGVAGVLEIEGEAECNAGVDGVVERCCHHAALAHPRAARTHPDRRPLRASSPVPLPSSAALGASDRQHLVHQRAVVVHSRSRAELCALYRQVPINAVAVGVHFLHVPTEAGSSVQRCAVCIVSGFTWSAFSRVGPRARVRARGEHELASNEDVLSNADILRRSGGEAGRERRRAGQGRL